MSVSTETVAETLRSRVRRLTGVQIVGSGGYVPQEIVANADLATLGYDADWIVQRTGILERRFAPPEMATSDMAVEAARRCLEHAGAAADEVDLIILGTFTPDLPVPATACLVQDQLGITAPAFDLQAACAGFVYSLVTAMQFVASGCSRSALVIGSDTNSRIANPADKKTYPLFGDGAAAVLLRPGDDDQGLLAYTLGADGSGHELLCRKMGGSRMAHSPDAMDKNLHYLHMEGRPVFRWAVRLIEETVRQVLDEADMTVDDIDLLVLHQANMRIIDVAAANLGIDREKVPVNLDRYGNTSAASIPLVLAEESRQGRITRGSRIMICGFGAGLAWGTGLLQW